jgi:hypothetical protein
MWTPRNLNGPARCPACGVRFSYGIDRRGAGCGGYVGRGCGKVLLGFFLTLAVLVGALAGGLALLAAITR